MEKCKSFRKIRLIGLFIICNLLVLQKIISGEIVSGDLSIKTCNGIKFNIPDSVTVKELSPVSNTCYGVGGIGYCDKEYLDSVDVVYSDPTGFWDGSECGGFYCEFTSRDTIWKTTRDWPANYQDITLINRGIQDTCKWTIEAFQEQTSCIPSIKKTIFLIRTFSKKFVLIKVMSQKQFGWGSSSQYCTANIKWWLQTDGSCEFSKLSTSTGYTQGTELKKTITSKNRFIVMPDNSILPEGNYFDCKGRQIPLKKVSRYNLLIRVENN
jgi:hypothetical protein